MDSTIGESLLGYAEETIQWFRQREDLLLFLKYQGLLDFVGSNMIPYINGRDGNVMSIFKIYVD